MRFMSIASGSSGNCVYTGTDETHILVDTGISFKRIESGLNELGLTGKDVSGILITHEHADHIQGLGVFLRKYPVPVYSAPETLEKIKAVDTLGKLPADCFHPIDPDEDFVLGDFQVHPLKTSHDAVRPLAYRLNCGKHSVAVVTDLGYYDGNLISQLIGLDALLLESNHDVRMLEVGPYPYRLKRRILSDQGHLSNETCGRMLGELLHDNIRHVFLGHLSKENNMEELARETVKLEIEMGECPYRGGDFPITVAGRNAPSEIVYI